MQEDYLDLKLSEEQKTLPAASNELIFSPKCANELISKVHGLRFSDRVSGCEHF
jgi:hypothetical protein